MNLRPPITLIAAVSRENAIGVDNQLPWHLPSDLAFFKAQTLGKPIVMGRKTWVSIGRALPGRLNVVISRQPRSALNLPKEVQCFQTLEAAINALTNHENVMIIGGAQLFALAMPIADHLILNRIDISVPDADTYFPKVNQSAWQCVKKEAVSADDNNTYAQTREFWVRKKSE